MAAILKVTPLSLFDPKQVRIKGVRKPDRNNIQATLCYGPKDMELILSAPKCVIPWKMELPPCETKRYSKLAIDAALADYKDDDEYTKLYVTKMQELREHLLELVLERDDIVDPAHVTRSHLEEKFGHIVKRVDDPQYSPSVRFRLEENGQGVSKVTFWNERRQHMKDFDYRGFFKQGARFTPLIHLKGIFFVSRTAGLHQNLVQVMAFLPPELPKTCLIEADAASSSSFCATSRPKEEDEESAAGSQADTIA